MNPQERIYYNDGQKSRWPVRMILIFVGFGVVIAIILLKLLTGGDVPKAQNTPSSVASTFMQLMIIDEPKQAFALTDYDTSDESASSLLKSDAKFLSQNQTVNLKVRAAETNSQNSRTRSFLCNFNLGKDSKPYRANIVVLNIEDKWRVHSFSYAPVANF